jgi:hypothetical protein
VSDNIDPVVLFDLISHHLPPSLKPHVLIAGSLAAAYHHRDRLIGGVVNTKDADVVIQPAGAVAECEAIAKQLLADGWRRTSECYPRATPAPTDTTPPDEWLRAVRLFPKESDAYFLELLAFPPATQRRSRTWEPFRLADGWYGLPCFRYLGLTEFDRQLSSGGLAYASPAMMALANLLSHPKLEPGSLIPPDHAGRRVMRSAKDLGRVLALAWLASPETLRSWAPLWRTSLRLRFPADYDVLAGRAGDGLRALLADPDALEQARYSVDSGLLSAESPVSSTRPGSRRRRSRECRGRSRR